MFGRGVRDGGRQAGCRQFNECALGSLRRLAREETKPLSHVRMLPCRLRKEVVLATSAAKPQAPMTVEDKTKFSPTICTAVLRLGHKALPPTGASLSCPARAIWEGDEILVVRLQPHQGRRPGTVSSCCLIIFRTRYREISTRINVLRYLLYLNVVAKRVGVGFSGRRDSAGLLNNTRVAVLIFAAIDLPMRAMFMEAFWPRTARDGPSNHCRAAPV